MKKILSLAIAIIMICGCALAVSAVETKADVDSPNFWGAHSEGVAITEEGVDITFVSTSYADVVSNWEGPMYILYAASEPKVNGEGYVEYWVQRGDNYGWNVANGNTFENADALAAAGITMVSECADWDALWASYVENLKAGCEVHIHAQLVEGNAVVTMELQGLKMTTTVPVDTAATTYISVSGEKAKLTGITVGVEEEPAPDSGKPESSAITSGRYIFSCGDLTFGALAQDYNYGYPAAGSLSASTDTDIMTITVLEDGTFTITDSYGRLVFMKGTYNSFNVGAEASEGGTWILEDAGDGKYYLKNVEKEKYVSYSEAYTSWGCYADKAETGKLTLTPVSENKPDDDNSQTGDMIGVVVALLAVSGMGIAVLKKR